MSQTRPSSLTVVDLLRVHSRALVAVFGGWPLGHLSPLASLFIIPHKHPQEVTVQLVFKLNRVIIFFLLCFLFLFFIFLGRKVGGG